MEGEVPEEFRCWECVPRPVDKERAVKLQKAKLGQVGEQTELDRAKRRASPGIERKPRRASTAATVAAATTPVAEHSRRKRRASIYDESCLPIDVEEPWSLSYVHIPRDIIPHDDTREKLSRQAHHWRGITALDDQPSKTALQPLPSSSFSNPALSLCTNPSVRPPSYVVHTSASIPSEHLIAPYKSTITPSSSYLSDPLNSYAHLGMPKPFVHLFGHPLDLALDSRITGNSARFVRSGCRPNAVLRPFLCPGPNKPPETLSFGIFALKDLKANEEVVLGWEWDDGHVVHNLPALIENTHVFPGASPDDIQSPEKLHHIRNQMSNILHALSSTFTTCACGARAKNCAITQMAAFVDGEIAQSVGKRHDLGPLVGARRGFRTREREPFSGGLTGVELCDEVDDSSEDSRTNNLSVPHLVLSPASHDDQTTLRVQGSPPSMNDTPTQHMFKDPGTALQEPVTKTTRTSLSPMCYESLSLDEPVPMFVDQVPCEDKMPPKMRKKWIQREASARYSESQSEAAVCGSEKGVGSEVRVENEMDVDGPQSMPPPRIPFSAVLSGTSPSTSFAQLSLVSPIIPNAPNPPVSFSSLAPLNQASPSAVRESSPSTACIDQSIASPHSKLPPAPEVDIDTEPSSEPPPEKQTPSLPESPQTAQTPASPPSSHAVPIEETASGESDDLPTTMDVPPSPLPALQEEANEEVSPLPPAIAESQTSSEAVPIEQYDLSPSAAEMPHATQKVKLSLKDFAMRKRKQREEEQARNPIVASGTQSNGEIFDVQLPAPTGEVQMGSSEADGAQVEEEEEDMSREGPELQSEDGHDVRAEAGGIQCNVIQSDHQQLPTMPTDIRPGTSSPHPTTYTRQAKQELIDPPLRPVLDSTYPLPQNEFEVRLTNSLPPRRQSSHEDGEISNGNDYALSSQPRGFAEPLSPANFPRSHTPPTQPRSFNASPHTDTRSPSPCNPSMASTSISRRPSLPPYRAGLHAYSPGPGPVGTQSGTITPSSSGRPLPSGPRALRTANLPINNSYRSYSGSQYVPRGPSADRDRLEWERERTWQRTRARGPGWGR
ncbi:hypothetical protein M378DRAFT_168826 [Amanita muscaria Koide BX008]|uniref:SET domain-containing protein n=1 Tax=Amanita muscaria (strain Koide BX008) TaxID=946122 RepID=A0A0C2WEK0_AMAMK|nr:hypothetical protein M378DRAFT_168826 [Amanita muscaria Koide BX008]